MSQPTSRRQQTGDDKRGSSKDRRARKLWMLSPMAGFGGDGVKVPCVHCGAMLSYDEIHADRIVPGGSYRRSNVQPSCPIDNIRRSDNPNWVGPLALAQV